MECLLPDVAIHPGTTQVAESAGCIVDALAYLAALKASLANSPVVEQVEIVREYATADHRFLRARLLLRNDDFLEVGEYFQVVGGQTQTVEYRYQWMGPDRQALRKCWDNTKHHPELPNFPHHAHDGRTGQVEPGHLLSIVDRVDLLEHELRP